MSDFEKKVLKFLTQGGTSILDEEVANVTFKDSMNTALLINFRSGKTLEIECDWVYKLRVNGEIVDHH